MALFPGYASIHKAEQPEWNSVAVTDFKVINGQETIWYVLNLLEGFSSASDLK